MLALQIDVEVDHFVGLLPGFAVLVFLGTAIEDEGAQQGPLIHGIKSLDARLLPCESEVDAGDPRAKAQCLGLCPAALPACRPTSCAHRCGTRTLFHRRLPVGDEAAVGDLGLGGKLFLEPVLCGVAETWTGCAFRLRRSASVANSSWRIFSRTSRDVPR